MRIRYILLVLFGVLALVPVAIFGLWSSQNIMDTQFAAVKDKHPLIARSLAATLQRYDDEIASVFELVGRDLADGGRPEAGKAVLVRLRFNSLCVTSLDSARVIAGVAARQSCPRMLAPDLFARLKTLAAAGGPQFTGVTADRAAEQNVFRVVEIIGGKLAIGTLTTGYLNELAAGVSFGATGHAIIIDRNGRVAAHPDAGWVAAREDISGMPLVKRVLSGETGIGRFHSERSGDEMIAGFAPTPGAGWGVIVTQPVSELYWNAAAPRRHALVILVVSLGVAAILAFVISVRLSRTIERVTSAIARPGDGRTLMEIAVDRRPMIPKELVNLQVNYNAMVRTLRSSQSRIRRLAYTDAVTALPNRESFQLLVNRQIANMRPADGGAMVFVNIDDFRMINDALGHDRGDQVLRALADRLAFAVHSATATKPINRTPDETLPIESLTGLPVIGSIEGDTFAVFLPGNGSPLQLERVLRLVRLELARPLTDFGTAKLAGISNNASLGAARMPDHGEDFDTLAKYANLALYHAKHSGKARSEIFRTEIGDVTSAEMRVDVTRGLKAGEFVLHYQPKVGSKSGAVKSVEALIRWEHPERGLLQPNTFIPLVEHADVVVETGEWALGEAARQIKQWDARGLNLGVAVNIAPRHFGTKTFARRARAIVAAEGVDPARIEIEITEEAILPSLDYARRVIETLRRAGFQVSLDDFGRGYSNLTRLAGLEVNTIKIDGPLTAGIVDDERTRVIVASTIDMAGGLGCVTVAEGVETLEQATMLRGLGCEILQGFYFARPMTGDVLATWVRDRQLSTERFLRRSATGPEADTDLMRA